MRARSVFAAAIGSLLLASAAPAVAQLACVGSPPLRIEKGPYRVRGNELTSEEFDVWLAQVRAACTWGALPDPLPQYLTHAEGNAAYAAVAHNHAAADITSGTIAPARLGSGTADSTKFLRGDSTWQVVSSGSSDHGGLTGLGDDDHTQYALLGGRGTFQLFQGGVDSDGSLYLSPNAEDENNFGTPAIRLHGSTYAVVGSRGDITISAGDGDAIGEVRLFGGAGASLTIGATVSATTFTGALAGNATTATTATTANAGDSATAFFSSGTLEVARLPVLSDLSGAVTDAQVPNDITIDLATSATSATGLVCTACVEATDLSADSVAASELDAAAVEAELEAVVDLADLQGDLPLGTKTSGGYAGSSTEGGAATTATALAANPTDCAADQFANAIDASGNLTCAEPAGGALVRGRARSATANFYTLPGVEGAIASLTFALGAANRLTYYPIWVDTEITIDRIGVGITTAGAASSVVRACIYENDTDLQPTSLVVDAGTVAADSTGHKEWTVNETLPPGRYLIALWSDGNPTYRAWRGGPQIFNATDLSSGNHFIEQIYVASALSTCPSTGIDWDTAAVSVSGFVYVPKLRVSTP